MTTITSEWLSDLARTGAEFETVPVQAGRGRRVADLQLTSSRSDVLSSLMAVFKAFEPYMFAALPPAAPRVSYAADGNTLASAMRSAESLPVGSGVNR